MSTQPTSPPQDGVDLKTNENQEETLDAQKAGDTTQEGANSDAVSTTEVKESPKNGSGEGSAKSPDDSVTKADPKKKISLPFSLASLLIYSSDDSDDCDDTDEIAINDKTTFELSSADSESDSVTHHITTCSSSDSELDELSFAGTKKKSSDGLPPTSYDDLDGKDLPPTPDLASLKLDVQEQDCIHMGTISSIVDKLVMVEALSGIPAYDLDTLLFLDKGKRPLGFVFDVIGLVTSPMYAIRFNSKAEIESQNITKGSPVYSAPKSKYTKYVFLKQLMQVKGSDASWCNDTEVPAEYVDFSDDEMEFQRNRAAKRTEMKRKRNSLERHQKFESKMNQRNIEETSRHVPRRDASSNSSFGYSSKNNNGGNALPHPFPTTGPVNCGSFIYYPPPVCSATHSRFVPVPHPAYVSTPNVVPTMPYNPLMYDPMASSVSFLFTPPPPPPEEPKQDAQPRTPIPPTTQQQIFQGWPIP